MDRPFNLQNHVTRWRRIPISVLFGCCIGALLVVSTAIVIAYMNNEAKFLIATQIHMEARQRVERLRDSVNGRLDDTERLARTARAGLSAIRDPNDRDAALRAILNARDIPLKLRFRDRIGVRDQNGTIRLVPVQSQSGRTKADGWSIAKADGALTFSLSATGKNADRPPVEITIYSRAISKDIASVSDFARERAFVLADRATVIAHSAWADTGAEPAEAPTLKTTEDLDLRNIWVQSAEYRALTRHQNAHIDRGGRGMMVYYFYEEIKRPDIALTVGFHALESEFGAPFRENEVLAVVASGALLAAVIFAVLMSHSLSRPIQRLAVAARQIENLSLEHAPRLERSVMRELDDANGAFLSAFRALGAFAKFVPGDVVRQVMDGSAVGANRTEVRNMTIMFTDLAGFTSIATHRSPDETASLLNEHFEMITSFIDREGGTVDKFLGDGVMAFWGAPAHQPDHAERALRAAGAIAETFTKSADTKMRLRIGICTGDVLVGITGSKVRMNYTVIGDSVNIAARLQELGKDVASDARAVALADSSTVEAAHAGSNWTKLGQRTLRGRDEPTEVYRLAIAVDR